MNIIRSSIKKKKKRTSCCYTVCFALIRKIDIKNMECSNLIGCHAWNSTIWMRRDSVRFLRSNFARYFMEIASNISKVISNERLYEKLVNCCFYRKIATYSFFFLTATKNSCCRKEPIKRTWNSWICEGENKTKNSNSKVARSIKNGLKSRLTFSQWQYNVYGSFSCAYNHDHNTI